MKKIILLTLFALSFCSTNAVTKRALVIGIGAYPEGSGWAKINGDKDIPVVQDFLVANGFVKQNIVTLANQQATCAAITREVENLIAKSQKGDVVYIHFSGHGQQVTDVHGDEEDGFDEAWIPFDAQFAYSKGKYEGQNHILDDQLNGWLRQIRAKIGKEGKLTVVADACHSGGGSRAEEDDDESIVVRGTADAFVLPQGAKAFSGSESAIDWIFISACKPYQCNYEYKGNGSLTYALSLQKGNLSTASCKQVQRSIRSTISEIIPFTQTPAVEVGAGGEQQSLF